jgi:hypothetical protein
MHLFFHELLGDAFGTRQEGSVTAAHNADQVARPYKGLGEWRSDFCRVLSVVLPRTFAFGRIRLRPDRALARLSPRAPSGLGPFR